ALLSAPRVLFLDEPTVGLDPRIRYELLDLIAGLRARGEMTILLTTHYLDEAERLCDRVAIVHEGRVVALDAPRALLAGLGREIVELRVGGDSEAALSALRSHGVANGDAFTVGSSVTIPLREMGSRDAITAIHGLGVSAESLTTRAPTLDDVYLRLTGSLLDPLNTMFSGIGVIVDRESGARRDMLAAPIPRPLVVFGNLGVAFAITALQVVALIAAAVLRGADFQTSARDALWFVGGAGFL